MDSWLDYFSKKCQSKAIKRPSVQNVRNLNLRFQKRKMNAILDKIRLLGIEKLSKEEKDF